MCSASVYKLASADGFMVTQFNLLDWQHSLRGTKKWTDLSHHAQLSMCTSRDKMAASGDGIQRSNRVWICCCNLMKSWLIMGFLHKICTRPIRRLVSQFYSSLGCFYPSGTTGRVVSSNTVKESSMRNFTSLAWLVKTFGENTAFAKLNPYSVLSKLIWNVVIMSEAITRSVSLLAVRINGPSLV